MRVITGYLGGRTFQSPGGYRTHPMSDKARGALFNALGDIKGLTVLDAFAGSGALSIEAISRGAASAVAIDVDKQAYQTIVANAAALSIDDKITAWRKNVGAWSRLHRHQQFDLVFADPPYDDIWPNIIEALIKHLTEDGLFVLSWPGSEPARPLAGAQIVSQKSYGDAQLVFYRRIP